jgi:hypothetical protein
MFEHNDEERRNHMLTMLSVASGMTGVCATAIGLVGIVHHLKTVDTIVDDIFAVGAMMFLVATALSFVGMRSSAARRAKSIVVAIDVAFLVGLGAVVLAALFLTWKTL